MKWAYGVTTVPSRQRDLLPKTLASLSQAGFDAPRLFIDGAKDDSWYRAKGYTYETTTRWPAIRTFGNWILALIELYIREPTADRYAIFQDDFLTYPNLRRYLETCSMPEKGYWNLYTFPSNQSLAPKDPITNMQKVGWYESNQFGRGAIGLVFSRSGVLTVLSNREHIVERPLDSTYGWRKVDGAVVSAMAKAGWKEYVHNPSLTQHRGQVSSMGNRPHKLATSFRGDTFDAMKLLEEG